MPGLEVQPFAEGHLGEAALLLRERHSRHREAEPLLPEEVDFDAEVEELWRAGASGAVAHRNGQALGFLLGNRRDDEVWGPNVWVEVAGHAVQDAEATRDLYAHAAQRWVDEGRHRHYVLVPVGDPALVEAWFRLGFGQQQAHGIREVPEQTENNLPRGLEIRAPRFEEVEELMDVDLALPAHQREAPVFSDRPLPTREEQRKEWEDTLARGEETVFVAYWNDSPVACWSFVPAELSSQHRGLGRPQRACYLGFAVTVPEARGSGIGTALTEEGFAWAAEQGYKVMVTDWRVTNLLASRFWPQRGFRTSFLRLYRSIP
jgi:ribosomal protein S18 acetylase RimI-like enzyme